MVMFYCDFMKEVLLCESVYVREFISSQIGGW